jgi:hypothetical protein
MSVFDRPFFLEYGLNYDRIKILLSAEPEVIAKVLKLRPDLDESSLNRCIITAKRAIEMLTNENICRNPPHASSIEGHIIELAYFLQRLHNQREHIRAQFAPEGFRVHFDRIFSEEYLRYEKYLYDNKVENRLIAPFKNFFTSSTVKFQQNMVIRKISQNEFHSLVEAEESYTSRLHWYPEFVICVPLPNNIGQESLETIISSLRLLKDMKIGLSCIYVAFAFPFKPWTKIEAMEGTKLRETEESPLFNISSNEEVELLKIYSLLNGAKDIGYLRMAIRRFNLAYEPERIEDSWIDMFVSLESLYSTDSELTEINHRLATRLSRASAEIDIESKKALRSKIKKWYTYRSKIVHGQKADFGESELNELAGIVRKSLMWFLSHQDVDNHDKIIEALDLE